MKVKTNLLLLERFIQSPPSTHDLRPKAYGLWQIANGFKTLAINRSLSAIRHQPFASYRTQKDSLIISEWFKKRSCSTKVTRTED